MRKEEYQVLYDLESRYWWFLGRTKIAFDILNNNLKKKNNLKILDAGCGTGRNIEYLSKYGTVYGVDFSEDALDFCKKKGLNNFNLGKIEDLPYKDNYFDLVTCFGVLYHQGIKDDLKAVKELSRVCKPRGYVLITTPAGEFLTKKLFYSQHDKSQFTARRHSKKKLKKLFARSNLEDVEITYMNSFLMPLIIMARILKKLNEIIFGSKQDEFKSELQLLPKPINKFLFFIISFENKLRKIIPLPFGLTIIGIGKKNH